MLGRSVQQKKCRWYSRTPSTNHENSTSAFSISFTNEIYSEQMMVNEADNIPLPVFFYAYATATPTKIFSLVAHFSLSICNVLSLTLFPFENHHWWRKKGLFANIISKRNIQWHHNKKSRQNQLQANEWNSALIYCIKALYLIQPNIPRFEFMLSPLFITSYVCSLTPLHFLIVFLYVFFLLFFIFGFVHVTSHSSTSK